MESTMNIRASKYSPFSFSIPRIGFVVAVLSFLAMLALTVAAHQIVLKDGNVIQFEKYRVVEGQLFYVNGDGKEVQIAISSIDLERTQKLSASDSPPLELPGLMPQGATPALNANQSLGEIAKQVRPKDAKVITQRVFTNDGVAARSTPSLSELTAPSSTPTDEQYRSAMGRLINLANDLAIQTPRQLGESVAGDTQFSGRADWEQRLYEQKEKFVSAIRTSYNVIQQTREAPTLEERAAAKLAMDKVAWADVLNAKAPYDDLKIEGAKKAADWKKLHQ